MVNEPGWVTHPDCQDRLVYIEPFLKELSQLDAPPGTSLVEGALQTIARTLRLLNVTVHDPYITDPHDLANLYRDLHRLGDAFSLLVDQ
ncbi:hypothetical protein [Spirosoma koreense]